MEWDRGNKFVLDFMTDKAEEAELIKMKWMDKNRKKRWN